MLHSLWTWTKDVFPFWLPAISNIVLVMLGIVMSLPQLADQIEKNKRYRLALALVCVVFGVIGFLSDVSQRYSNDSSTKTLVRDANEELETTKSLLGKTNTLLAWTASADPKLHQLDSQVDVLNKKIEKAQEQHDPKLVAKLQTELRQTQHQADDVSAELLAIATASRTAEDLRDWELERQAAQTNVHNVAWDEQVVYVRDHHLDGQQAALDKYLRQWRAEWEPRYAKVDQDARDRLVKLIGTADLVRKALIPKATPNPAYDRLEEAALSAALNNPESLDRVGAATYLDDLVRRVRPPK